MAAMAKAGVFDSGIGGLSILREIMDRVPMLQVDYISDDSFAPYGTKSDREIIQRSEYVTDILLNRGAELVVVACNSATAAAISVLREKNPETSFVGVEPYINVLNHEDICPGIEKAAVITTVLTGNSRKFNELRQRLDPDGRILHFSLPDLATIVERILEEGLSEELSEMLKKELSPLHDPKLSHLILGCTHYPLIAGLIEKELGVTTISAAPYVAKRVMNLLPREDGPPASGFSFLSTSNMRWEARTFEELNRLHRYSGRKH